MKALSSDLDGLKVVTTEQDDFLAASRAYFAGESENGSEGRKRAARRAFSRMVKVEAAERKKQPGAK